MFELKKRNCHPELVSGSGCNKEMLRDLSMTGKNLCHPELVSGSGERFRIKSGMTVESGRSMVEMLGVLAIVGVLSVMGIAGYTAAMRAHKANEIVNATSMCYMLGMAANGGTGGQQLVYSPKTDGVASITFKDNNQIEIDGLEDATLCAQVKNKLGDKATECPNASPYKLTVTLGDVREAGTVTQDATNCTNKGMDGCTCDSCPTGYKLLCVWDRDVAKCTKETGDKLLELCTQINENDSYLDERVDQIVCNAY